MRRCEVRRAGFSGAGALTRLAASSELTQAAETARAGPSMPALARNILLALCVPVGLLAAGYLNAWATLDACADEVYRQDSGRSGVDMLGRKRPLQRGDVSARIKGPFQVEASYMLPADIHGTVHVRTYLVFGGYRRLLGSDEIHLVRAVSPYGSQMAASDVGTDIAPSVAAGPERG